MTPEQIHKALARLERRTWCPHAPTPRQAEFLALPDLEALYGGAAGGGKTDALLMAGLQYVHVPNYSAIIFRKTFQDLALPDSIMDRAHQWLGGKDCSWDGIRKRYTFPTDVQGAYGATLQFGYLDSPQDKYRYKSAAFQFAGFDEVTTLLEGNYTYLLSRLRRLVGVDIPLRARSASNPGDIGHEWVKARFVDGPNPFIAARMDDNPYLDHESYREALSRLDEITRRQLQDGIWEQDAEGLLYQCPESAVIDQLPDGQWQYIRALDFGIVDRNAIVVLGWRRHDQATYILSARYFKGGPYALAEELKKDGRTFIQTVGDLGGMGKSFQEDIQLHAKIPIEGADKSAKLGAIRLLNDEFRRGTLKVYRPACADLLKEYRVLLRKPDGKEVDGQDNHCADATLYGWRASPSFLEREKAPDVAQGSQAWEQAEIAKVERELKREAKAGRRHGGWLRQMGGAR